MGSTAHRLRHTRDRVTKSTRRAHASQRRTDRTIDTSRTPVRRHLRSPGAAHHSTPHTPDSAKDTTAFFAVIAVYYSVRLFFLDAPSYVEAKYSEWPETCFSLAVLFWCAHVGGVARSRGVVPVQARDVHPRRP